MKNVVIPVLFAIIIGLFMGFFLIRQYDVDYDNIKFSSNSKTQKIYYIQQGVYSSKESMEKNTIAFENYIYILDNNLYYVFIGITSDSENAEKIKEYYKSLGYDTYVKEGNITNDNFIKELINYDSILSQTNEVELIQNITKQTLKRYGELVDGKYKN